MNSLQELWCSTKTNSTNDEHIPGSGHWGLCKKENCPSLKGKYICIVKFDNNHYIMFFILTLFGQFLCAKTKKKKIEEKNFNERLRVKTQ